MAQHVSTRPPARLTRQLLLALLPACGLRAQAPAPVWQCQGVRPHGAHICSVHVDLFLRNHPKFDSYSFVYKLCVVCHSCGWVVARVVRSVRAPKRRLLRVIPHDRPCCTRSRAAPAWCIAQSNGQLHPLGTLRATPSSSHARAGSWQRRQAAPSSARGLQHDATGRQAAAYIGTPL